VKLNVLFKNFKRFRIQKKAGRQSVDVVELLRWNNRIFQNAGLWKFCNFISSMWQS